MKKLLISALLLVVSVTVLPAIPVLIRGRNGQTDAEQAVKLQEIVLDDGKSSESPASTSSLGI